MSPVKTTKPKAKRGTPRRTARAVGLTPTPIPASDPTLGFTICIDSREQRPYSFDCMRAKCVIPFGIRVGCLQSGDYSVDPLDGTAEEYEVSRHADHGIAIERKSLQDLYSTMSQHRERFEDEFKRLSKYGFAAIVIEAEWSQICYPNKFLNHPTGLNPKSVIATLAAWKQRYGVHVETCPGREFAEQWTFRLLERWYRDRGMRETTVSQPAIGA